MFTKKMNTAQLSDYLGYKVQTIKNWCKNGKILYRKINGRYEFDKSAIDILIENKIIKKSR